MCEMLGEQPSDDNIPVEIEDFPDLVVQCFIIYRTLADIWDTMNGNYLGKDYSLLFKLLDLYNFEQCEHLLALQFIQEMDACRAKIISEKLKAKTEKKP